MRRDLRDGNTYRAYVADYPELNDQVRMLGRALQPHGPANFQFRTDADGTPCVFEINARFSGTTPLRAMAGFNEVEMRSEEHTSELQSLMRISYAVFCLKKKNNKRPNKTSTAKRTDAHRDPSHEETNQN